LPRPFPNYPPCHSDVSSANEKPNRLHHGYQESPFFPFGSLTARNDTPLSRDKAYRSHSDPLTAPPHLLPPVLTADSQAPQVPSHGDVLSSSRARTAPPFLFPEPRLLPPSSRVNGLHLPLRTEPVPTLILSFLLQVCCLLPDRGVRANFFFLFLRGVGNRRSCRSSVWSGPSFFYFFGVFPSLERFLVRQRFWIDRVC